MSRDKEKKVLNSMILLYCRKKHGGGEELCGECRELAEYAGLRLSRCPFGEEKSFCSGCKIHCYKPDMRQKIRKVMRFSGPRMLLYHPLLAVGHAGAAVKQQIKRKKLEK